MKSYYLGADLARMGQDSSCYIIIEEGVDDEVHKVVFVKEVEFKTTLPITAGASIE